MSELRRLAHDPSVAPALRQALLKAADETAPPDLTERVLGAARVGAGAALLVATEKAVLVGRGLSLSTLASKVLVGLALFAAGGVTGGLVVHRHDVQHAALATRTPTAARTAAAHAAPTRLASSDVASTASSESAAANETHGAGAPAGSAPVAIDETGAADSRRASRARSSAKTPVSQPFSAAEDTSPATRTLDVPLPAEVPSATPARPDPTTADQLASLRVVRDAVRGGRPLDALAAISEHRARFPGSPFDEELLLLEGEARAAQREPEACALFARFLATYPRSLLVPRVEVQRVRAGCGDW